MEIIQKKAPTIFWILIPIILLVSFLDRNQTMDINIYDTYLIIENFELGILASIFFCIIGLIYWLLEKLGHKTIRWMSFMHIILTTSGVLWIVFSNYIFKIGEYSTDSDYTYFDSLLVANMVLTISLIIVIISQFLLLINCVIGIVKK